MKVVDIHPEELIDKLNEGSLTVAERERLDAHLALCSSCRFEIAVRLDLAEDLPAFEERPPLTFAGGAPRQRALSAPREPTAPQVSLSLRARSRRRWPLVMLAAALVLCAGGAMGAVITGAVSARWLGFAPAPKPAESSVHVSEAKAAAKVKRPVAAPAAALAPAIEPIASSAARSSVPAPEQVATIALPKPVPAVSPSVAAPLRRAEAARSTSEKQSNSFVGTFAAVPAAAGTAEAPATRVDAATMFADANRARRDGNADRAVGLYRALQSRYPNSSESELSRALLAQLLLDRGNPEAALAGFDRYLAEDTPVLSAEALVGRARALEQLGKSTQAAAAWRQVQSRFPGSVHARLATTRLAALGMR